MDKNTVSQAIRDSQAVRIACRQIEEGSFCLIVEDEPTSSRCLVEVLKHHNYQSRIATSVDEAIGMVHESKSKIMCAIIDLHLGDREGEEVLREIEREAPEIPCIIHTGDSALSKEVHRRFPRTNILLKGSSMFALLAAFGFDYGKEAV